MAGSGRGSSYLEVVVRVPGFVLPGVVGRRGPLEESRGVAENHQIIVTNRFLATWVSSFFQRGGGFAHRDSHKTHGSNRNTQIFDRPRKKHMLSCRTAVKDIVMKTGGEHRKAN